MKRQAQVPALAMDSHGLTVKGRSRAHNEDAILWPPLVGCAEDGVRCCLVALADGVGGGPLGEVASATAAASLRESFGTRVTEPADTLRASFASANAAVLKMARTEGAEGAATTLVALLVTGRNAWVANVGDSRAYLVREGEAVQITLDHLVSPRHVSPRGARSSVLTRAIGTRSAARVDIFGPIELREYDSLVLCSDGLHQAVESHDIVDAVSRSEARRTATELCGRAQTRGGDDVSVVVCKLLPPLGHGFRAPDRRRSSP